MKEKVNCFILSRPGGGGGDLAIGTILAEGDSWLAPIKEGNFPEKSLPGLPKMGTSQLAYK